MAYKDGRDRDEMALLQNDGSDPLELKGCTQSKMKLGGVGIGLQDPPDLW
jgi:hypothetical protein